VAEDLKTEPEVLDYEVEKPHVLRRRDSSEYYREQPVFARVTGGDVLMWIISFVAVCFAILWLVGRWFIGAWN